MSLGELNKLDMQSVPHTSRTVSYSTNLKKKKERETKKKCKEKKTRKSLCCPRQWQQTCLDLGLGGSGSGLGVLFFSSCVLRVGSLKGGVVAVQSLSGV